MIADVRAMLKAEPFEPFTIVTSGGKEYTVPTPDHADISPKGGRVVVWFDDESSVTVSGLHITAVEKRVNSGADTSS